MDSSTDHHRPHRTTSINCSSSTTATATGELFICSTNRLHFSSSSMKLPSSSSSSKTFLSLARARDAPPPSQSQISLSSSRSRRLRSNGSLKGGQFSPMFPSGGKKRCAAGIENPEPSSPKVTCIGQVRVKTRKQGKKLRTRSVRKGELSFRKLELSRSGHHHFSAQQPPKGHPECLPHTNQKWVHLPMTICEALRTFGADWNCFLPCRSSCMSSNEEKAVEVAARSDGKGGNGASSCGAVIARWFVAVQDGEGRGRREIELVVGGEEIPTETNVRSRSQRRHVLDGIEFNEEMCREKEAEGGEQGRVSISIPPKNALLLMRCRSDPVKMAVLANRFCGSPFQEDREEEEQDYEDCQEDVDGNEKVELVQTEQEMELSEEEVSEECVVTAEASEEQNTVEAQSSSLVMEEEEEQEVDQEIIAEVPGESVEKEEEKEEGKKAAILGDSGSDSSLAPENEGDSGEEKDEEDGRAAKTVLLAENNTNGMDLDDELASIPSELESDVEVAEQRHAEIITMQETAGEEGSQLDNLEPDDLAAESKARDTGSIDRDPMGLPDSLMLMMCEPKLSMEVSRETWVCSRDLIWRVPERHLTRATASESATTAAPSRQRSGSALTSQQVHLLQQPPRSSCSFPSWAADMAHGAAQRGCESTAALTGQKLLSVKPGEPAILPRCKSEPERMATKLAPDPMQASGRTRSSSCTSSRPT